MTSILRAEEPVLASYEMNTVPVGPSSTTSPKSSIRLLTLNTWGLKFISKHRKARLHAIADRLASAQPNTQDDYDIVALQEIWCQEDWDYFNTICLLKYPFRRQFKAGIVSGPGLAILSKLPIEETFLYRFPINGRPSAFWRGDWYVGKSVSVTILKVKDDQSPLVALLNTHMHAPYGPGDASYSCHRACQVWDCTMLINLLKKAGFVVILVGDLNCPPGTLPHDLYITRTGLEDSWSLFHELQPDLIQYTKAEIASMAPEEQILLGGVTCDSTVNTFRLNRRLDEACRLDYALIDSTRFEVVDASVRFHERLPGPYHCSYSDHFGYFVELSLLPKPVLRTIPALEKQNDAIEGLLEEIHHYLSDTIPFQEAWRKWHFFISVLCFMVIQGTLTINRVSAFWISNLGCLIGVTGLINGMIWYFSVRSEKRALEEVREEVLNFKAISNRQKK
ncbi:phospholipase C type enzyme [Scheffersomyces spartinae]|uniref:Phospholipase C type enzyme n=1 Tax=Scheffersomyces spartinae TaxID=45513 RepID=A0A9P7V6N4_9ASCO|nr:phospholipase C type enzyme [Scheffersomyces spartinae]KAG7192195.1 phospholipase C type enzyme [Scheffersomyces spartinae]